jgi:hypothetical protein
MPDDAEDTFDRAVRALRRNGRIVIDPTDEAVIERVALTLRHLPPFGDEDFKDDARAVLAALAALAESSGP